MDDKRRKRKHEAGKSGRVPDELKPYTSAGCVKTLDGKVLNLFTLEERIKDKAGVGEHVVWESVLLLYAARIRLTSLAHSGISYVVIGAIWHAVSIFGSKVRRWWMG